MDAINDSPAINYSINNELDPNDTQSIQIAATKPDFTILWQNLTYKVDSRPWYRKVRDRILGPSQEISLDEFEGDTSETVIYRRERKVLNQICGEAKSREMMGILGPSGAGKSSLLYCLFQNRTQGTSGHILVDSKSSKRLKVCFIPQKDYLSEYLTVREDLIFVSKLRHAGQTDIKGTSKNHSNLVQNENESYVTHQDNAGASSSLFDHNVNACRVADLLGLSTCLDVKISNISGGQRKRLSIARELMSKPDILILDEPTTGLDSLTCLKTMTVLKDLSRNSPRPMAVIVTIHQPSRAVFNLFDKTYFISNRGHVVYNDSPQNVISTLANVAGVHLARNKNPASALIEISSDLTQRHLVEKLSNHQKSRFNERYEPQYLESLLRVKQKPSNWNLSKGNKKDLAITVDRSKHTSPRTADSRSESPNGSDIIPVADSSIRKTNGDEYFISHHLRNCLGGHSNNNWWKSFMHIFILTHRSWLSVIRNPTLTRSRLVFHAALPFIMIMIYGTASGSVNACPKVEAELSIADMRASLDDSAIKKNVLELRGSAENVSFFFILMYGFAINIISATASYYPLTIHMFRKEIINGLYSPAPYFIGQTIAELPLEILFPSLSIMLSYPLTGQPSSYLEWRLFALTAMIFLLCYTVHSVGLLLGSIFINNVNLAVLVGQISLFPQVMFSGFLIRSVRMPLWMIRVSHFSFFKHALEGICAARYGFNICNCDEDMIPEEGLTTIGRMPPNVKHLFEYLFPKNETNDIAVADLFDKLGERFSKAQTFALNITTCDDVKPYVMTAFGINDFDLIESTIALLATITVIKIVTFSIIRLTPYRID